MARKRYSITGCPFLDSHGVTVGEGYYTGKERLCTEHCPYPNCVLTRNEGEDDDDPEPDSIVDITVYCTKCKTMETITIIDKKLVGQRFAYDGQYIYHKGCGYCKVLGKERVK